MTFIKFALGAILIWSFAESGRADERAQVIQAHRDAINWIELMNLSQLKALQSCLLISQGQSPSENLQPFFSYFIAGSGQQVIKESDCRTAVHKVLGHELTRSLAKMRLALALAEPRIRTDQPELFFVDKLSEAETMTVQISHQVRLQIGRDVEPLTPDERQQALAQVKTEFDSICTEFRILQKEEQLSCQLLARRAWIVTDERHAALAPRFRSFLRTRLQEFRQKQLMVYLKQVEATPLLLYLKSHLPKLDEIQDGLSQMIENAEMRVRKIPTESDAWFVSTAWAFPYTRALLHNRYPEQDFTKTFQGMVVRGQRQTLVLEGAIFAGSLGLMVACQLTPGGKAIALGRRFISKKGCLLGTGFALNSGFLAWSILDLDRSRNLFLSALSGTQAAVSYREVLDVRRQVWMAMALFPLFLWV